MLDIEQCNMALLDQMPADSLAIFVMATYGEGEPTDNAAAFWDLLQHGTFSLEEDQPLHELRYFIFGLGNSSYTYFNQVARTVDEKLTQFGATRLGERGEGDDDKSLEDDFMAWKEATWPVLAEAIGPLAAEEMNDDAPHNNTAYIVQELPSDYDHKRVYLGELGDPSQIFFDAKKPYPATIMSSRDLLNNSDRHCLHLEIDISGSGLSYTTGDHVAIWATNSDTEVLRLARIMGIADKLDTVFTVKAADETATKQSPFPVPTTYRAMFRHYLDICQLPSRQVLQSLVPFCPTDESKAQMEKLATDKDLHQKIVLDAVRNLAQVLEYVSPGSEYHIPMDVLLECFGTLQPRYYSISSSSSESPNIITVTAVTLQYHPEPTPERTVFGVNTNYMWAVHNALHGQEESPISYSVEGPGGKYFDRQGNVAKLPVHVRRSNFKLPADVSKPVIMIGPGTGVAPFRGFVRERVYQKQKLGKQVGPTILFFGCRRSAEDYLYADEWPALFSQLDESSRIITAFSREKPEHKVYVQDRLRENGAEIWNLIFSSGAYVYICGDAKRMAKDVYRTLVDCAKQYGGYDDNQAVQFMSDLKAKGRYQEDVWA